MEITNEQITRILTKIVFSYDRVLEVACGGGWLALEVLKRDPKSYEGFDFSETAARNASDRARSFANARTYCGDALNGQIYTNEFDLIVAHQFLHCLIGADRKTWLRFCHSSLKPSQGRLLLSSMVGIP